MLALRVGRTVRPIGSRRACGASGRRRVHRRWCSCTCRTCAGCWTATARRSSLAAAATSCGWPTLTVDAVRFERLLDEAQPREALALWRGEALADVADEPFAAAQIRRLDELRLHAAELAIDADLAAGRHGEVIGELDALIADAPAARAASRAAHARAVSLGRQAEALEAYRDARAVLVDQIGVEPGPELRRLQEAMLAQDPALDGAAAPPPTQARPPPARPPPRRRTGALIAAAAVLLFAGAAASASAACSSPTSSRASTRTTSG